MLRSFFAFTLTVILPLAYAFAGTETEKTITKCYFPPEEGVGLYAGIFGGANLGQTGDRDNPGHADARDFVSNDGWFSGLKLGYAFKPTGILQASVEVEAYYSRVNFQSYTRHDDSFASIKSDTNANQHTLPLMVNAIAKLDLGKFRPYVGVGVGAAHVWLTDEVVNNRIHFHGSGHTFDSSVAVGDRDEFSFAAQGIAGAEYLVTPRIGLFGEYKALYVRDSMLVKNYISHLLGGGVRVYF
jgi:opacity protein-like surface antigen